MWFPFKFPLLRNFADITFHIICRCFMHSFGNMAVNIHRQGSCGVTEVFLDGFNIIARFKRSHGKRMTEIMESSGIQTNFFDSVLESFINIDMRQMPTYFICENEVPFLSDIFGFLQQTRRERLPAGLLVPFRACIRKRRGLISLRDGLSSTPH